MKTLFSKAFEMLLNLGRALKPRDLQKEVEEVRELVRQEQAKADKNMAKLNEVRQWAIDSNLL